MLHGASAVPGDHFAEQIVQGAFPESELVGLGFRFAGGFLFGFLGSDVPHYVCDRRGGFTVNLGRYEPELSVLFQDGIIPAFHRI